MSDVSGLVVSLVSASRPASGGAGDTALVSVVPADPILVVGGAAALKARIVLADLTSEDATDLAVWSSSEPEVASICAGPDEPGRLCAHRPGTAVVFARVGGKVGWTTVTVL